MSKGDDTRQTILGRAFELANVVGVSGLTIGRLAEDTGLSKSGLFAHFGSKEALEVAVVEEAGRQFVRDVMIPALAKPRGLPRLRAMFERWLAWGERPGRVFLRRGERRARRPPRAGARRVGAIMPDVDRRARDRGHARDRAGPLPPRRRRRAARVRALRRDDCRSHVHALPRRSARARPHARGVRPARRGGARAELVGVLHLQPEQVIHVEFQNERSYA